ncbi:MAG: hypothetical protein R3B84_08530 [Zavarzinella sp.]
MLNSFHNIEQVREEWTDLRVVVRADVPELQRFADWVGRVVTVNCTGKILVDFGDGAWYDLAKESVEILDKEDPRYGNYKTTANSAQAQPTRQS